MEKYTERVIVRLTPAEKRKLEELAKQNGKTISQMIRLLLKV